MGDIRNAKKVVNCNRRDSKFRALLQRSTLNKSSSQWQPIIIQRRRVALLGASALLYFMASASPFCLSRCTKFYVYSFTACLAVSTSPINHVGLLALTCILPIISYHHHHHHRFISHEAAQYNNITFIQGWRGGLVVGRRTCDLVVAGSRPGRDAAA